MVRLREIPRTAAFAWSPGSRLPFIATGSKAGAVDADFSTDTTLELWDLGLQDAHLNQELQPVASITTDSRFHDINWVDTGDSHKRGVIAGALESGALDIWDADKLISNDSSSLISRTNKHSGAIKSLQFNAFRHELLATAGAKGELYINDLNNLANPFRLGNTAARADDFEAVDWNKKVPHIMATGSSGGFVTVWDVKSKKESLTLNNQGRKAVSAIVWDPEQSTRLITAVPLDQSPVILIWDLRNTNQPQESLQGHEGGVLSLSWCQQDPNLLLSCGKDNRTICWNPQTAQAYGDFPVVTNWTFQTRFNPHNPDLLATASFDGKIAVQTLQNTKPDISETKAQALDDADFFANAQTQPQASSFSLPKAPSWLERPCGVSFGFGGKIVKFGPQTGEGAAPRKSTISISSFAVDEDIGTVTEAFAKSMSAKDLRNVCETRIEQATLDSEKTDWKVIETLTADNPRKELISYIGIYKEGEEPAGINGISEETNGTTEDSAFFEGGQDGDNFLSGIASTKGAKTNNPFKLFDDKESDVEKKITKLLLLGQFEKAMEVCLIENRLSDAFMIAMCGGQKCMDRVQKAYFKAQRDGPNYVRLLASVVGKNLWDLVYNADLKDWKEVMATLCTYASTDDFPDLCEALGDRLEDLSRHESDQTQKQNASFCYIAGSKLEKVVGVWIQELEYNEQKSLTENTQGSSFSIHAKALQTFIEKVTVFREVTRYQDKDRTSTENWKLQALYEKYVEYADIVASHGQLQVASQYLSLLPDQYPAADVARNRIRQAMNKPVAATTTRGHQATASRAFVPAQPAVVPQPAAFSQQPSYGQSAPFVPAGAPFVGGTGAAATNPYAPAAASQPATAPSGPYAPSNPYAPQQPMQIPGRAVVAPPPNFAQGPPRTSSASPAITPAAQQKNMTNWNDTPADFFKAPTSRRATPAVPPPTMAPPPQQQYSSPNMAGQPFVVQKIQNAPAPPPPKGAAMPPRSSTPQLNQTPIQPPVRPPSSAANNYAPQPNFAQQPPPLARGPSPYNPPPAGATPPLNRYAPIPGSTPQPSGPAAPPQPIARGPPPPNPYASRQSFSQDQQYAQPGLQQPGPPQGPPQGPPMGGPSQFSQAPIAAEPPRVPAKPPTPKFPPGDRSHIPANAKPVFDLLSADMQRVKSKAPPQFSKHVEDTEKRLNILFDNLNNQTMLQPNTIQDMVQLATALQAKDYDTAMNIHLDIFSNRTAECGNWMPGVKRLITMSRATA